MTQTLLTFRQSAQAQATVKGVACAEVCLEKTRQTVDDWPERAYETLAWQINLRNYGDLFTAEEAVATCYNRGLIEPHDDRAWGGIFLRASRAGLIRKSAVTYRRVHGHGSPAFKWEITRKDAVTA